MLNVPAAITGLVTPTAADRKFFVGGSSGTPGTYKLTATAANSDGIAIPSLVFTIDLTVKSKCDPPGTVIPSVIPDVKAKLNDMDYTFEWAAFTTLNPSECPLTYSASIYNSLSKVATADVANR